MSGICRAGRGLNRTEECVFCCCALLSVLRFVSPSDLSHDSGIGRISAASGVSIVSAASGVSRVSAASCLGRSSCESGIKRRYLVVDS